MVADLTASAPGPAWDRLVFCLKEVVFKVWYPLAGSWLDFDDAAVVVDRGSATFRATLLRPAPELAALGLPSTLQGSWVRHRGILVAAVRIDDLEGSAG
jgi:4'-phosphopantetheinyl transferase EntD